GPMGADTGITPATRTTVVQEIARYAWSSVTTRVRTSAPAARRLATAGGTAPGGGGGPGGGAGPPWRRRSRSPAWRPARRSGPGAAPVGGVDDEHVGVLQVRRAPCQGWRMTLPGMLWVDLAMNASRASASGYTAPTCGRSWPASTRRAQSRGWGARGFRHRGEGA